MSRKANILVIDDDPAMLELARFQLNLAGYDVSTAEGGTTGLKLAENNPFDLVLTDLHMPDIDGIEIVNRLKELKPELEIILISGLGTMSDAIEATRAGAFWFLEKPLDFKRLQALMEKALQHHQQAEEVRAQASEISQLRGRLATRHSYFDMLGASRAMQDVFEIIESVAETDANVLIIGESGAGKELIASAIHYRSQRAKAPFIRVNCAALPRELIESELFGHTKGAFTGAGADKNGLIGQANGGSLLLDEIGEMPIELQPKLLRVLQERVYTRLGSEKPQEADFRLIAATNRDPQQAIRDGILREDLYYRLNTILIRVPPLRERTEDIQSLAEHFLRVFSVKYRRPAREFSPAAWDRLLGYHWPGNVRELQNIIERVVLLARAEIIEADAIPFDNTPVMTASPAAQPPLATATVAPATAEQTAPRESAPAATPVSTAASASSSAAGSTLEELCEYMIRLAPLPQRDAANLTFFEQLELPLVRAALVRTNGNKQAAADLLGIYRPRLYNILRRETATAREPETES
ncbi:MAG: sigma-54-dependent transcriptional regulator [Blastocatellia bacterium]